MSVLDSSVPLSFQNDNGKLLHKLEYCKRYRNAYKRSFMLRGYNSLIGTPKHNYIRKTITMSVELNKRLTQVSFRWLVDTLASLSESSSSSLQLRAVKGVHSRRESECSNAGLWVSQMNSESVAERKNSFSESQIIRRCELFPENISFITNIPFIINHSLALNDNEDVCQHKNNLFIMFINLNAASVYHCIRWLS